MLRSSGYLRMKSADASTMLRRMGFGVPGPMAKTLAVSLPFSSQTTLEID